jgi:hypothetical protein
MVYAACCGVCGSLGQPHIIPQCHTNIRNAKPKDPGTGTRPVSALLHVRFDKLRHRTYTGHCTDLTSDDLRRLYI